METPCKVCDKSGHLTGACSEPNSNDWGVDTTIAEKKGLAYAEGITSEDRRIDNDDATMALMYFHDASFSTVDSDGKEIPQCHALATSDSLGNMPDKLSTPFNKWNMATIMKKEGEAIAARSEFVNALREYTADPTGSANEKVGLAELLPEKVGQKIKEILILEGGENSIAEAFKRILTTLEAGEENITDAIQGERGTFHTEAVEKQLILRSFMKEVYPELDDYVKSDIYRCQMAITKFSRFQATVDDFRSFVDEFSAIAEQHSSIMDAISDTQKKLEEPDDDVKFILGDFGGDIAMDVESIASAELQRLLNEKE